MSTYLTVRALRIVTYCFVSLISLAALANPALAQSADSTLEQEGRQILAEYRHLTQTNKREEALAYLRKGLTLLDGARYLPAWLQLALAQGEVQKLLGRREEALATYRLCLENAASDAQKARIFNRIAAVFIEMNQIDSCLLYVDKSVAISEHLPENPELQVWNDHLTGVAYMDTDRPKARLYLERALKRAERADPENVSILLSQLAVLADRDGNLAESRDLYLEAANTALASGATLNHLWVFHNLAKVYHRLGQDKEAFRWLSLKDSAEFTDHKEQIAQAVGTLTNEVALASANNSQAQLEHEKNIAETRSLWAVIVLTITAFTCLILFVALRKVSKQRTLLTKAHAELDTLARSLKRGTQDLENANQTKALMLSVIGHDLRSPLASLQGIMGLVNDVDLSQPEFKVLAERIGQDVNESRFLLDDLLLWAKSQMEGLKVEITQQNPVELLTLATRQQRAAAEQRQVMLETDLPKNPSPILADAGLLKTVLRNLVANAIQHSPVGSTVGLSIKEEGSYCRIRIVNSHSVMSDEDRILLSSNLPGVLQKRLTARNGFGLILIKDFVLLMSGRAEVELPAEGGTAITILLPLVKASGKGKPVNLMASHLQA